MNRYKILKNPLHLEQHTEIEIRSDLESKELKHTMQIRERGNLQGTNI